MNRKSGITSNTPKQKAENREITKLQSEMENLKLVVRSLHHRLDIMEAKALVSSQVTNMLEKEVDRLNQYGRRSPLIIKGIPLKERETNNDKGSSTEDNKRGPTTGTGSKRPGQNA